MIKNILLPVFLLLLLMIACESRTDSSLPDYDWKNAPVQSMYDSEMVFTDSGSMIALLKSSVCQNFDDEQQTQIFPEGVRAYFYNQDKGEQDVLLLADSAINIQKEKMMRFYGNVVIYDYRKGDTVYTEALYWNQKNRTIHSDVKVRQVGKMMVLEGDGFDSDDRMNNFILRRPRGIIY